MLKRIHLYFFFQKIIPLDQETPASYERMGGTEVVVPQKWLFTVLAKCKGKGPSFTVKKLVDGFFEPKDLKGQKASLLRSNKIIQAIRCTSSKLPLHFQYPAVFLFELSCQNTLNDIQE